MKSFKLILFLCVFLVLCTSINSSASDKEESKHDVKEFYDKSASVVSDVNPNDLQKCVESNNSYGLNLIIKNIQSSVFEEIKRSRKYSVYIILICILGSLIKVYIKNGNLLEISSYICLTVCSLFIVEIFRDAAEICSNAIDTLSDYMSFAVPVYVTTLISCGYVKTASSIQWIFMIISSVITNVIKNIIHPLLLCCGILSVVECATSDFNMSGFVSLISKTTKYIIGFVMTVFAGVLTFTGLSSVSGDNLAIKTAKYAIGNFVPVVGGCLSEALNTLIYSSAVTKNAIGYVGFFCLLFICLSPIVKAYVLIFMLKLSSACVTVFGENIVSRALNAVCEVLVSMIAMVILVSIIFILIITIVATVG